jgi:Domain of unknown function (DUF5753)/Helix-turn-helix domain
VTTDQGSEADGSPTVLRIVLGTQLRNLRENAGISRGAAGFTIRASESKISRMELGRVGFKERDVADLIELYGVTDEAAREPLLSLARQANAPAWWHEFGDILPNWFQTYVGLESAASLIRTYEVQFVPGLLQSEDYARAVSLLGYPSVSQAEVDRRVSLRVSRQKILTRPNPPLLWAVIDEAALRRPIGGAKVMRAQIEALLEAAQRPNIKIQVIPVYNGGHAGTGGSFTLLRFPGQDPTDMVYLEHVTNAVYLNGPEDLDQYTKVMESLSATADPPSSTAATLHSILDWLDESDKQSALLRPAPHVVTPAC